MVSAQREVNNKNTFLFLYHTKSMKKIDYEKRKVLEELKNASPNQVGRILKKFFKLKKDSQN